MLLILAPTAGWAAHWRVLRRRLRKARHDPLTGLALRGLWCDQARRLLDRRSNAAVVLIDLNRFKDINDTFGHAVGDAVLAEQSERLVRWCRGRGTVGRLGGDEFAAVVDADPARTLEADLSCLAAQLAMPVEVAGTRVPVSAAVGAATCGRCDGRQLSRALKAADKAMYVAKQRGIRESKTPIVVTSAESASALKADPTRDQILGGCCMGGVRTQRTAGPRALGMR